jgi:hypothetical protein
MVTVAVPVMFFVQPAILLAVTVYAPNEVFGPKLMADPEPDTGVPVGVPE